MAAGNAHHSLCSLSIGKRGRTMDLQELRARIDAIDDHILELLNERAHWVTEIGKIKIDRKQEVYVPSRERAIFERLERNNKGPFPSEAIHRVFREIISASLSLESPLRVVYLGPKATFTHMAALNLFGHSARLLSETSIHAIFDEVTKDRAHYGVVPIENSTEGAVTHTLDMFAHSDLKIIAETYLEVSHDLLSKTGKLDDIRRIYSHTQALEQCRRWLADNCAGIQLMEVSSTARAAQIAAEDESAAAVAGGMAAHIYRLRRIASKIEDHDHNFTRFLVMGKKIPVPTDHDKTSVMFSFEDKPGILSRMLEPFRTHGLNLTKIESRPIKKKAWEYLFFLDIEGHIENPEVAGAIADLESFCTQVKHLGSYPRAR